MTKAKICDKMKNMKTLREKIYILIVLTLAACAVAGAAFNFRTKSASAAVVGERVLPVKSMETDELSTPQNVFAYGETIAINENSTTLRVYVRGERLSLSAISFTDLGTLKMSKENEILVSDNGSIYKLTVNGNDVTDKTPLKNAATGENIGSDFDYNGKYVIANNATQIITYSIDGTVVTSLKSFKSKNKSPIAINADNAVFFVGEDSGLYKSDVENTINQKLRANTQINKMVADKDYVYYIERNDIYRISVNGGEPENITPTEETFELGKLITPTGICFKGDNLLVTDSALNAVQEFYVKDGKLVFTGFAVTKGKTAYNRIGAVKDVDRYLNKAAVLSDEKLTVITFDENFDGYNPQSFENLFTGKDKNVTCFALGKTVLAAAVADGTAEFVKLGSSGKSDSTVSVGFSAEEGIIKDITYQSGYFYVLTFNGTKYLTFKISETGFDKEKTASERTVETACVAADVFGNLVYGGSEFTKIATDLTGRVYGLKTDGELCYTDNGGESWHGSGLKNVTAFAMNFDKKEVFYATNEREFLYSVKTLDNFALSAVEIPDGYKLTGTSVSFDKEFLKVCKVKDGEKSVNAYSFNVYHDELSKKELVEFIDLAELEDEYLPIANANPSRGDLYFCAGRKGVVLISGQQLSWEDRKYEDCNKTVFVTTGVQAYYHPVITQKNIYSLIDEKTEEKITFKKNDALDVIKKITVLDKEFYLAKNNATYFYIPSDFTVDELAEDYKYADYKTEKVKKTVVYKNASLGRKIAELDENQTVRVLSEKNGVAEILFNVGDGWEKGYVKANAIINESQIAVRNILIVLALIACVCGSVSYFVLRKKA